MSSTPQVIWDDQPKAPPVAATTPQVQWDDEAPKPTAEPTQPVKPAPVQITQPNPAVPPAIAEQVRTALPNIAQYPENQQKPDPDYVQRKAAFEAVQGEPGAPQDFEYDAEQERRIKAQEQVDSSHSMVPQAAVPALAAAKKYAVDPFEKASKTGALVGRDLAARALVTPPVEIPMQDNLPPVTEQEVQERLKDVPAPVVGTARAAGSVVGGVVADPRMWPLFFMGPEASAAKTAMSAGFAGQMAVGAYEQAGELGKIMDNPDVPQEDKWEAGANMVLSTLMAAQAGGHPAMEAVKARLKEFQNLPPADQEQIRNILREKAPEIATEVDKSAETQPTESAAPKVTWDDQKTTKPERFRLPRGTSAAEVQGEVKGPNIRTVQVGDKTYAFDQRKINADGVKSAVERNELWRLTGGKAPEAAKVQAEADVRGEESQPATEQSVKEQAAPEVKWDDEAPKLSLSGEQVESEHPQPTVNKESSVSPVESDRRVVESSGESQPERRTDLTTRKRVADLTPDERSHELLTSELTKLPNKRAFEEDSHTLGESHPHVGYADLDDFKRYNDALGHEGVDKAVLPAIGDIFRDAAAKEPSDSVKVYHRSGDEFNFRSTTPEAIKRVMDRVNKELAETTFRYQTKDGRILEKKGTGLSHGIGTDHESAEENSRPDKQRRKELGLREGGRDVSAVDTRGAAGEQTAVRENTERERVPGKPAEEVKPSQTISGHLNGRRSSKIGTLTLPDKTVLELSVRPDPSQMGVYSLAASNGKNSTSYRMQYKGRDTLADVKKSFEEYLNIDSPGHEVTIGAPKQPHEMTLPEFAKNQGKPADNRYVQQQHEAVKKKAAPSRAKLSADKLSDFQVGRDKVVREGDRTYVVDRSGSHARTEVLSDAITPEFKANAEKLTPEQRQRMIETVKTTPYLSDEGRKERIDVLQGEPEPGSQEYETLRQTLAAAESKGRPSSTQPTIGPGMQRVVARLRTVADGLGKQIEDKQRSMTSNPTPKRMREYRSRLHDGENMKRVQQAMRALADAHESGTVPKGLENLRTKDEIYRLVYKGVEGGGGYYDVIPSHDYANKTPQGKALQELMERHKNEPSEAKEAREKASKISQLEADVQFQKLPGYFPTPKPVVEKMLDAADIQPGEKVLEPSAGKGNIADLIKEREPESNLSTIEPQSKLRQILELKGHELADSDFLGHKGEYDKIVMNPPFENGQDIDHVQHAFEMLKPGGKLVAIMSESPFFRSDRKGQAFRDWLEEHNGTSEKLEPGSFKGSGTGVNARMVEIEKPKAKAAAAIPSTKQPWQMTKAEWMANSRAILDPSGASWTVVGRTLEPSDHISINAGGPGWGERRITAHAHETQVERALRAGKPVPAEVLKDYPDLKPAAREPISTAKQVKEYKPAARINGEDGNPARLLTPTGEHRINYRLVESGDLVTSHNPLNFAADLRYPDDVQERAYHTSKEAQARVIHQTDHFDPDYILNTNPDAVNGAPIITPDGFVLGGNSRAMTVARLYHSGKGEEYRKPLLDSVQQFGLDKSVAERMKEPVIVRELQEPPKDYDQMRGLARDLNKNMTGALGVSERAVSAGKAIKPETMSTISAMVNSMGDSASIRDVMRENGNEIARLMVKDGVFTDRERPQYADTSTGGLSEEGKTFVERALLGSVVDDPTLMDRVPKSVLNKLDGSLADISTLATRTDEYNLLPMIREALEEHAEMARQGVSAAMYLGEHVDKNFKVPVKQNDMFAGEQNPALKAIVRLLADKPTAVRKAIHEYAQDAKYDNKAQATLGMGTPPTPVGAFNAAFKANLTEVQFTDALLQSLEKGRTISEENRNAGRQEGTAKETSEGLQRNPSTQEGRSRAAGSAEARSGDDETPAFSLDEDDKPLHSLSKDELRDWAVAAGRRVKIEEMGEQGGLFGNTEKMYRLSTSKENSVAVTQAQLDSLKEQIPALGGKRIETQNMIAASLNAGENGLFADRAPVVTLTKAARDVINTVGGFRDRFNGANMSARNVRTIAARLAGDMEPMGEMPEGKQFDVRRLADTLRQAADSAGKAGVTFNLEGAPESVLAEETFHAGQRQLGEGEVNDHLSMEAGQRLLDHPLAKSLDTALTRMGYSEDLHPVSRVAEIAAKIATDDNFFDPEEAADWMVAYFDELHQQHGEGRVQNVAETLTERAQEVYNSAKEQLNARRQKASQSGPEGSAGGNETAGGSLRESEASRPQEGSDRRNPQNASGKADQGKLDQPPLFSRDKAADKIRERGSATPSAMPIPALISSVAGVIKKGRNLYHGAVDKALDWAHMGQTRPEIRKFDPDAADLATKMDAGSQYHKAVAEMIGKKVTGPLAETFDKTDNYASRQKKNEISRDRMKGFHFLADAQNREWLEENHPEDFHRWNADPKIKEALDAYKPFEGQLRDAVKQLGGKTINEDYIKRIMYFATSGVAYEKGLDHGVEGPVELRQGAAAGAGGGRDSVVSPQIDRSKARKDAGKFYWDHGVFDFGPSFEKRWVEVQSKLDEHRLAVHSMSMGTRIMPDEAMPEKVFYNGQEFYRPDIAKEIREVQKRGVSAESKALADALGVSELPTPKDVREYANYEPLRRGSRFETAARNLAANVLAGKEGLEGQAANVNRMAKLRYALPKEIVDALNDAGREKELGAASKLAQKVLGPLTQFIRQQIVGLAYGVPHMANILRKVVQATPGAALNPMAWANAFKVAFSKELKARGISGTEDPTYNMLLRNAAVSEGAVPEYKRYIEGNMDAADWAQTIGNAFRRGGKEGAKVTPLSATAGLGRLAIEPLNRFSEAGHRNLFKPGGIDQRARLWLGDFLKDRYPGMNEQRIAHEVNQTLGRYNRASWTDVQRNLGPLMLFPGWDYSSMAFALKHPFKTAVAPAVLMLLANAAVHSIGGNKNDEKNDLERVHIGKYSVRTNLFNDNMGSHMWGWALRGAKAGLDHKNAKEATGEVVKGIPGDVAGVTTGTMNPILSTPIQVGENRLRPGGGAEIAPRGDFKKKGHILPNKAAEDYADFGARRLFPIYDRATQAGQRPSLASFAGLAGASVNEKKKKK